MAVGRILTGDHRDHVAVPVHIFLQGIHFLQEAGAAELIPAVCVEGFPAEPHGSVLFLCRPVILRLPGVIHPLEDPEIVSGLPVIAEALISQLRVAVSDLPERQDLLSHHICGEHLEVRVISGGKGTSSGKACGSLLRCQADQGAELPPFGVQPVQCKFCLYILAAVVLRKQRSFFLREERDAFFRSVFQTVNVPVVQEAPGAVQVSQHVRFRAQSVRVCFLPGSSCGVFFRGQVLPRSFDCRRGGPCTTDPHYRCQKERHDPVSFFHHHILPSPASRRNSEIPFV